MSYTLKKHDISDSFHSLTDIQLYRIAVDKNIPIGIMFKEDKTQIHNNTPSYSLVKKEEWLKYANVDKISIKAWHKSQAKRCEIWKLLGPSKSQ